MSTFSDTLWFHTLSVITCTLLCCGGAALAESAVTVRATGQAPADLPRAREEALEDGLRRAVETGGGVSISSITKTKDYQLIADVITAKTAGYVRRYKVLKENPNQEDLYTVRVEAVIDQKEIKDDLEAFQTLLQRKGFPQVVVVGASNGQKLPQKVEALVQSELDKRGLPLVQFDSLPQSDKESLDLYISEQDADSDLYSIGREAGVQYLVLVQVDLEIGEVEELFGITTVRADSAASLQVVSTATGKILASAKMDGFARAGGEKEAKEKALARATKASVTAALERVAQHWMQDVDSRGGGFLQVKIDGIGLVPLNGLVSRLEKVAGVKQVIIDSSNPAGASILRILTNAKSTSLASVLQKLSSKITVDSVTEERIEVSWVRPDNSMLIAAIFGGILLLLGTFFGMKRKARAT